MNKELSLLLKKLRRQKYPKLEVMKKLEDGAKELDNIKLEDMTKDEVYLRYVFCGTDQELKKPEIARLLIRHGYIQEALFHTDFIVDKQVILELLKRNRLAKKGLKAIQGRITKMKTKEEEVDINCFLNIEIIEFTNEDKSEVYKFEYLCSHLRDNKNFENEVTPYKDNIIAIVEKIDTNPTLKCFVKFYEDIDYQHL